MAFAMFEIKLVLAAILSHNSFTLAEKQPLLPVRRGLTFAPKVSVRLVLKEHWSLVRNLLNLVLHLKYSIKSNFSYLILLLQKY
jgi:hypothetical protein